MMLRGVGLALPSRPGRERFQADEPDLSTFGQRTRGGVHPDALAVAPPREFWTPLERPVPGRRVWGTLADGRARFVLRLPREWNGGLVVAASPGLVSEHANDLYWSDHCLARGFAFASTDKGVRMLAGEDAVVAPVTPWGRLSLWYPRLRELGESAREEAARFYGRAPSRAFAVGLSNGGYLARRAAEDDGGPFDGAVDVSGVFWDAGDNLLTQLPAALRAVAGAAPDRSALRAIGLEPASGWDTLLPVYRTFYWPFVLAYFLEEFDPGWRGELADYDLSRRPEARERLSGVLNTGRLSRPLVSVHGGGDLLLAPRSHAAGYADQVRSQGAERLHRVIRVDGGSHVDADRAHFPFVQPLLPYARAAFDALAESAAVSV